MKTLDIPEFKTYEEEAEYWYTLVMYGKREMKAFWMVSGVFLRVISRLVILLESPGVRFLPGVLADFRYTCAGRH